MHSSCSNDMPPLPEGVGCGPSLSYSWEGTYNPSPGEAAFLDKVARDYKQQLFDQVDKVIDARTESLAAEKLRLMVGNEDDAQLIREYLVERGWHNSIEVHVAAKWFEPENYPAKWPEAPVHVEFSWNDKAELRPRHRSPFTKSQPSPKARKASRRRAKDGRKASR